MRILPVLDVKEGVVVRGVGGRRREYRPVVSRLMASCRPVEVAEAFRAHFGLDELYLADLDAIAGAAPELPLYTALRERGFRLWVDAGIRDRAGADVLASAGIERIVVGLETIASPPALSTILAAYGERVVFSLDLKDGRPLGDVGGWDQPEAWSIARQALALGVRRLIVLDLARVGGDAGTGTEALCRRLKETDPEMEVIAGGGVRDVADLRRLAACGVSAALVASALHDGRLSAREIAALTSPRSPQARG